ncbi:VQ motif-containing protein 22-like [Diospyros lotus]|uniref:VQ motif-containing protein 22-like n=1 Tax=Diospyros lotus TaxID=55363 RepID=UPI0022517CD6|nr:VQ motif-containing protein 22-like [Diospyros lotus]
MSFSGMPTSGDWIHQYYYQEPFAAAAHPYHDSTVVTTSASAAVPVAAAEDTLSPNSSSGATAQLNPRSCISKPARKRSRASKKTPITLLSADAANFRALVQQFTGSPRTALSFGGQRGPFNINFAAADGGGAGPVAGAQFPPPRPAPEMYPEQHEYDKFEYENIVNNPSDLHVFPPVCSNPAPNVQNLDNIFVENVSLYELLGDAFS